MPRPKLPPDEKRSRHTIVTLNQYEDDALEAIHARTNLSRARILRETFLASLQGRVPRWVKETRAGQYDRSRAHQKPPRRRKKTR